MKVKQLNFKENTEGTKWTAETPLGVVCVSAGTKYYWLRMPWEEVIMHNFKTLEEAIETANKWFSEAITECIE